MDKFYKSHSPDPHIKRRQYLFDHYKDEIKSLIKPNPWSMLIIVFLVGVQFTMAYAIKDQSLFLVALCSYLIGAFFNHSLYVFVHEASHNLIFKRPWLNRMAGLICDMPLIFPGSQAFRTFHLFHHNKFGQYDFDADLCSEWEAKTVGHSRLKKLIWMTLFFISQGARPLRLKTIKTFDTWVFINIAVQIMTITLLIQTTSIMALVYLFLSTFFCLGLHPLGGRWIAEHYNDSEDQETFSYYGPLNILCFNIGHHSEHHDIMSVPWNKIHLLKKIAPELYDRPSYHSYTKVLYNFIMNKNLGPKSRVIRES